MVLIPVRCYSCGKVIGHLWEEYKNMLNAKKSSKEALDDLGLKRWCCRRIILGHVELIDRILMYCEDDSNEESGERYIIEKN